MSDAVRSRIGILDNDELTLAALRAYLSGNLRNARVDWSVTDAKRAVSLCLSDRSRPDIFITDMSLNESSGVQVIRDIRERTARVPILAVTSFPIGEYAQPAAEAGAQGIIAKRDLNEICNAISVVLANRVWIHDGGGSSGVSLADCGFESARDAHARLVRGDENADRELSERECAVIDLFSRGLTSKQTAERLGVSENTVKTYARRIFGKLGANTRGQAIAIWISLPKRRQRES